MAYPEEVYFTKLGAVLSRIVDTIPDGFKNTGKWGNSNTSANKNDNLVLLEIF
jgi:hypothetical protein